MRGPAGPGRQWPPAAQPAKVTPSRRRIAITAVRPDCAAVVMAPQLSTHWPAIHEPSSPGWS